jgi:histone arginine demethylase JMJD6
VQYKPFASAPPALLLYSVQVCMSYLHCTWQVGSDDEGYPVRMRFDHFLHYCVIYPHHAPSDDSPLYIFDGTYGDRTTSKELLDQYKVPHLFPEDIFGLVGERRRPPYRCVGRSSPGAGGTGTTSPPGSCAYICSHAPVTCWPPLSWLHVIEPKQTRCVPVQVVCYGPSTQWHRPAH